VLFCSICGASIPEGAAFCVTCGNKAVPEAVAAAVGGPAARQQPAVAPAPQYVPAPQRPPAPVAPQPPPAPVAAPAPQYVPAPQWPPAPVAPQHPPVLVSAPHYVPVPPRSPVVPPPPVRPSPVITQPPTWHVCFATGQTAGPFTEEEVRAMIARQQLKITDSVVVHGGSTWVPITQSPFAPFVAGQAQMDRLASSTCPRCGAGLAVVFRRSTASRVLILLGIMTLWIFGFGLVALIIGIVLGRDRIPGYECPRCRFRAS